MSLTNGNLSHFFPIVYNFFSHSAHLRLSTRDCPKRLSNRDKPKFRIRQLRIDLRLVINGLQKPLKRFVHEINPHNQHYTDCPKPIAEFGLISAI
jgi:hypothetical protein